jgi:hypothetical protein
MFSVITNIYNKKTKEPTLMEWFTATGKTQKFFFFLQLEMFYVFTTGDTSHIDTIFQFLPHTHASTRVRPLDFCSHRHPFSVNCLYHPRMVLSVGGFFTYFPRNARLHSNQTLTLVIFQHTKRRLPRSGHFLTTYIRIA